MVKYIIEAEAAANRAVIEAEGKLKVAKKEAEAHLAKEKAKADVSPSQIILKDNLNKIGIFKAEINFHSEVKANISIKVDKIQSK